MAEINFGPFALSVSPLLILISVIIGFIVASIVAKKNKTSASNTLLIVLLAGLVLGRLVFLVRFYDSYDSFWQMLDIRDSGIDYTAAVIGFAVVLFLKLRQDQQRKALLSGVLTMIGTYAVFTLVITLGRSHTALPESRFMQLDGQQVKITDISQNKPTIVNLWTSGCEPCQREMPLLELAEQRHNNVTFIMLNQRESSEAAQQFLQRKGFNFQQVLLDSSGEIATNMGVFSLPVTLFFDVNGQLVLRHMGELSAASLQQNIEQYF
jgi:thiol-disulfide isomerase/thioredoxin